ncbi:hypothetical protein D0Z08_16315 [Nocardioides immobilis]|uniref:Uncharacterized protein n=1 Tax=Nocardioides immobilis TaxID=2049295 RepID=A0A417XZX8_9ACTN|nr:hypothetical protein [Nocardioides immobilis]RHW25905.1 hypothetical protein D0Z08_16315 [Nocardioides immobilis]
MTDTSGRQRFLAKSSRSDRDVWMNGHDLPLAMAVWLGRDTDKRILKLLATDKKIQASIVGGLCDLVTLLAEAVADSHPEARDRRDAVRAIVGGHYPELAD